MLNKLYGLLKKPWQYKLFRFACIGTINTLLDLSILNFLVFIVHINPLISNLISASTAITISYFLNHRLVFRDPRPLNHKQFIHFFLVTGLSILVVQDTIIALFTHLIGIRDNFLVSVIKETGVIISLRAINLNIAKLIAVIAGMVWNFLWYHKVVFRHVDERVNVKDNINQMNY